MSVEITPEIEGYYEWLFNEIADRVKSAFKIPISDEQIRAAIRIPITEPEIMLMYSYQDAFCVKCGTCCRMCNPIECEKEHFRKIAKSMKLSYKKLKKRTRSRAFKGIVKIPGNPCPFLEGKNHCTIYELRPLICKKYPMAKTISSVIQNGRIFIIDDCPASIGMVRTMIQIRIIAELMEESGIEIPSRYSEEEIEYVESLDTVARLRYFEQKIKTEKRRLSALHLKTEQ